MTDWKENKIRRVCCANLCAADKVAVKICILNPGNSLSHVPMAYTQSVQPSDRSAFGIYQV